MQIEVEALHQEGQQAPLNTLPLKAAFDELQSRPDCCVNCLHTHHIPGQSLKDTDNKHIYKGQVTITSTVIVVAT